MCVNIRPVFKREASSMAQAITLYLDPASIVGVDYTPPIMDARKKVDAEVRVSFDSRAGTAFAFVLTEDQASALALSLAATLSDAGLE